MADTASTPNLGETDGPVSPETMEMTEQVSTYRAFNGLVKWGSLGIAAMLLFLVLEFCTRTGFLPSAFIAVVVLILGFVGLRKRVAADPVHSPS